MSTVPVIGESFKSFYDPNGYYTGSLKPFGKQRLLNYLDEKRAPGVRLVTPYGPTLVSGRDLVAVELAHAMLIADDNFEQAEWLGLSDSRLSEAVQIADFGASAVVRGVRAATDLLHERNSLIRELSDERDPLHLLSINGMLSAVSHKCEIRLSGVDYFYHTVASAAIAGIAARKEGENFTKAQERMLRRTQGNLLGHDGWENAFVSKGESRGRSFLASPRVVPSPLVHYRLRMTSGLSVVESFEDASTIFLITKTVGPEKEGRMKYDRYGRRLHGHPMAEVCKMCDIRDNLDIDPKHVEPIDADHAATRKKILRLKNSQNNYRSTFKDLQRDVAKNAEDEMLRRIGRNVRFVTPADLDYLRGSTRILATLNNVELLGAWGDAQASLPPHKRVWAA